MTPSECRQSAQGDVVVFVAWCRRAVPCVRSSVTFVYSVKTNKHIFKFFSSSAISKLNVMAVLLRGPNNWGKNRDFRSLLDRRVSSTFRWWSMPRPYPAINKCRRATHQWILFITGRLDVTLKTTEQNLILLLICDAVHNAMTSQQCNTNPYSLVNLKPK